MSDLARNSPDTELSLQTEGVLQTSDLHYRGIFDAAQDGILVLDAETRRITDANPFLCELLGYSRAELLDKELWEIGLFSDRKQSQDAFHELREKGEIRYEDLPLETKSNVRREVEFISKLYREDGRRVILCIIRDISERKRIEKEKYFLAAVVESLEDSVVSVDFDTIITSWNKGAERLYGYSAGEVLGKPLTLLTLPEDLQEVLAKIEQVRRGETVQVYETERVHKDGQHIFLIITLSPVKDAHGWVIGVSTLARDITPRRRAEAHLRKSEAVLRRALEIETVGVLFFKTTGEITSTNDAFLRMCGYTREDVERCLVRWDEMTPPEFMARSLKAVAEFEATGRTTPYEKEYIRKDGSRRWALFAATRVSEDEGVEYVIDITERKRLAQQVEHERSRLKYLFENAPAFVAVMREPAHIFELANPAYYQLVGRRDLIGKPARETLPEVEGQGFFELLDQVYQTGEPFVGHEMPIFLQREMDAPQEERFINFVYHPIIESDGAVSGIFVHGVDVTEQVTARKIAEEANRLKDQFLATLSHELRSPLNSIVGYSEVLLRSPEARQFPLIHKAGETIYRNAQAQAQLINDLLDLSRLQTGKFSINRRPVSLAPVVGDAVEAMRGQAGEKEIKLDVDLAAEPLVVNADPVRVQQIVWNLVTNAVKFTPRGGRVSVSLRHEGSQARLVVEDTGQGIGSDFLPHIFEMFRQGDACITRTHGGMGIGLALVRQLAELHDGQAEVYSEGPGRGARFTVRLPLHTTLAATQPEEITPTPEGELTGARILVVDDSQDSLDMMRLLLTGKGAAVETVLSGEAGLLAAERSQFDLIISDISMPGMDGYEFLRNLRVNPRYKSVPAIALTGFGREEDIESARLAGFTTHLTKPVDFDHLLGLARITLRK